MIAVGGTQQYTATATDTNGNIVSGLTFSWSSNTTSVATISSSGLATGVGAGKTQITASASGVTSSAVALSVNPALAMTPMALPLGAKGTPYITNGLTNSGVRSGGVAPFLWSLANGTVLPAGLSLNSNGSISGEPTNAGTTNFTIQVTDSEKPAVSQQAQVSMVIVDPVNSPCSVVSGGNESIMNGSYAFLLQGFQATNANGTPVAMAGSFATDGTGKITGGEEDLNLSSGPQLLTINGGSYAVSANGQGCVQLKYSNSTASVFHFALSQVLNTSNIATHGRIIEFDGYQGSQGGAATKLSSGVILLQNTSEFHLANLASRYAFGEDGIDSNGGHVAVAGSFSVDTSGNITNLAEDVDDAGNINGGTANPLTGTGTLGAPDTNGRSAGTITISGGTVHVAAYVVNTNEAFLVSADALGTTTPIYSGRAILTAAAGSYPRSLSGNFMFRAAGIDRQGDGAACAASGPCAAIQAGVVTFNSNGTLTGTQFFSQAGVTQQSAISGLTYAVNSTTGRVALTGGQQAPVLYLATPVPATAPDATEPISAFLAGTSGDALAFFGFAEAQPAGPYSLNSPPSYIFGAEDVGQIDTNYVAGSGTFASGTFNATRDISGPDGLLANPAISITFTINADGTMSSANTDGATNSTSAAPGRFFFFGPTNTPAALRGSEP